MTSNNNKPRSGSFHRLFVLSSFAAALCLGRTAMGQQCDFYPIALSAQQVSNAAPGTVFNNIANGAQAGNFGWLSWGGSPSETALVASLTTPGNSSTYVNPDVPNDHQISIGDWVSAKPGVSNSKGVRDALDALEKVDITVPVWDKTRGSGDHAAYHVVNFARVRVLSYQLPGQNKISAKFLGFTSCGLANVAPVVNAGADASITVHTLPGSVTLNGSVSDDGLPAGGSLTATWSVLSGAGTVTFGNSHAAVTTASFGAEGIYVLQLSANDGELASSDTVTVSVNRTNQAPVASAQTVAIDEDTVANISLAGSDADGDALAFQVVGLPQFGTLSGTPPNVVYTPKADYNGQDSFTFKVNDGSLDSATATVNITIQPVNDAPVADAISVTNNENTSATITLSGSDVEGSALTYVLLSAPAHGTLNVGTGTLGSPQLIYTPTAKFSGSDSFTFKVNDGQLDSAPATVSITGVAVNQAPDVNAGADQIVSEPTDSVALAGVVTDDNFPGNTVTVQWSKVSGPGAVTFADATSRTTSATFGQTGVYVLRLTATDGQFESDDDLQVTVNAAPVVSAGDSQTITLPDVATLNGSATDDGLPVGSVLNVSWEQVSGPGAVVFDDAHAAATSASFSKSGVYVLRLTASDSLVSRSSDVTVTANHVPVVDAGSDQLVTNLQAVLNGTAYDDGLPSGTLTTTWSQISGPGVASFDDANSAATGVTFSASGVYVLQLMADDSLAQTSAQVTITVDGAPVVNATSGSPVNFGNSVALSGSATDDGLPNGSTVAYAWSQVSGPGVVTFDDATAANTSASFSQSGTYVLQFAASDSLLSASTTVSVIVNGAPTVSAGANQLVNFPQSATLNGSVSDDGLPNGTVTSYWTKVSGPGAVTFGNASSATTTASFSGSGVYVLRLTANDGLTNSSSDVTVTANGAPTVGVSADKTSVRLPEGVSLYGNASDDGLPNGTLSLAWTVVSGSGSVSFSNPAGTNTTASFSVSGSYTLRLTANDSSASANAEVTIQVLPPNQPPVVNAGANQVVNFPSAVALNGTVTDDGNPQGATVTSTWSQVSGPGTISFGDIHAPATTATASAGGVYVLRLTADDTAATSSADVTVKFNRAPVAQAQSITVPEGQATALTLSGTDPDGDSLQYVVTQQPLLGTLSGTAPNLAYTSYVGSYGADSIQFYVTDGMVTSAVATVSIQVSPIARGRTYTLNSDFMEGTVDNLQTTNDQLQLLHAGNGSWSVVFDSGLLNAPWAGLSWNALIPNDGALSVSVALSQDGTSFAPLQPITLENSQPTNTGRYLKVVVNFVPATSGESPTLQDLSVGTAGWPVPVAAPQWQISAGDDISAFWPDAVPLKGVISRSPHNIAVNPAIQWSMVSGPGTVTFDDTTILHPAVHFSTNGIYQLRITADNNGDIKTDDVMVSTTIFNRAPVVDAGPNLFLHDATATAALQGSVTDDGLPFGNTVKTSWTQLFGPGSATFANSNSPSTSATFSTNGIYVLQLSGDDGQFVTKAVMTVRVGVTCTVTAPTGIEAWWQANGTGADAVNGNSAVLETGANYAQGKVGGAFNFDGVNARVSVAANSHLDVTKASNAGFTVEFWVNPSTFLNGAVLGWTNGVRFDRVSGGSATGDTMRFYVTGTNSGQFVDSVRIWPNTTALSNWYHYAATYDRASGVAKVYVNGALQNSAVVGTTTLSTGAEFYMGQVAGAVGAFKGQLDEVSLYNRALDPEEVFNIFASGASGKCALDSNQAPVVDAGPDLFLKGIPATTTLNGQVSDDGLPAGSSVHVQWSKLSGPGTVTFGNANAAVTSATFSTNGVYVLQLAADDQDILTTSLVEVRVETLCTVDDTQGLAAWWTGNNNDVESLNGYDAVQGGGSTYMVGKVGAAFSFNGSNSYVWMPSQSSYDVGSSASGFTVEFWANPNSFQNGSLLGWANGVRVERVSGGSAAGDSMRFFVGGTNSGQFVDSQRVWSSSGTLNQWYHIALTYDRTLGQAKIYTNGVLQVTGTVGTSVMTTAADFYLGQVPGSANFYSGGLDEVSLYKRPLNPEEVYSVFASGSAGKCPEDVNAAPIVYAGADLFVRGVPGTATLNGQVLDDNLPAGSSIRSQWSKFSGPGTVTFGNASALSTTATFSSNGVYVLQLTADDGEAQDSDLVEVRVETLCTVEHPQGLAAWWPGNGASDDLINGYHALLGSGTTYTNGKVASAFLFNGVNNYVWMPAQSSYDVGSSTAGFTLEFWMNPNSLQNASVLGWANGVRVDRTTSGSAAGDTLRFYVTGTNSGQFLLAARPWGSTATLNQWYHIALTYDRTSGVAKAYTNGVLLATTTVGTNVLSTAGDFYLGQVPGLTGFFSGGLDEVSIYKRALNPEEVYSAFTSGSAGKCPEDNNQAPVVYAGPDQTLVGTTNVATLSGFVTDDGLPTGSSLRTQWSKVAGPGSVTFNNSNAVATTATFSSNGVYVLQLTADDSEVRTSSTMQVRVGVPCTVSDPSGLVAFWPGNGTSDDVINGYHGELGSGTTYTNGKVAAAFSFNGVNNFVLNPAQSNYNVGTSASGFSLEFWMNPNSFQNANVLGWNNGVRVDRVTSGSAAGDTLRFVLGGTNNGQFVLGARPWASSASLNQWYHIALTYDRTLSQARIYTNGVLLTNAIVSTNVLSTAGDFYLGNVPNAPGFFSGALDEVSLYNRPLALAEVQAIFSAGISGKCITVPNRAPYVTAGGNHTINLPTNAVTLFGAAYDDGKPGNTLSTTWTYVSGPSTVFFSSFTNPVTTITFTNTGVYTFQLSASDGLLVSNDTAVVTVLADARTAPTVAISGLADGTGFEVPNSSATATVVVTANASDNDGVVSNVKLFEDGTLLSTLTVPPYTMSVSNVAIGSHTFTAVATDNDGLSTTSAPVSIIVYVDALPVATIFSPAEAASVAGQTAIVGTASSPILQAYQLQYRFKVPQDAQPYPWTTSATSNSSVVSNIVATFDPSLLLNGIYEIQLSTTDVKGRTATSGIQTLLVSQTVDLTNFMLAFSDVTVPAPGMPIQITRTYDSRDHRTNEFGIGWSLDVANVTVQKSANLATNWLSSFDGSMYSLDAIQPHRVMITMAGNKTYAFEASLSPSAQSAPIAATRMTFTNLAGTDGTLEIDGDNRVNVSGVGGTLGYIDLIDFSTGVFFNPTRFKFTTAEGNVYILDEKGGVQSVSDSNSNTLTITTNGISHSSGVSVSFVPDSLGRITTITDGANQLQYGYGANGSLATFTFISSETNTTSFGYSNPTFPNLLTDITDSNGVHSVTLTPTK